MHFVERLVVSRTKLSGILSEDEQKQDPLSTEGSPIYGFICLDQALLLRPVYGVQDWCYMFTFTGTGH